MNHIRVNLTNVLIIGTSSFLFLWGGGYVLIWLSQRRVPVLTPIASAILGIVNLAQQQGS